MSDSNYFSLFGLPQQFDVDINVLNNHYRKIQSEVHPDKFVTASPAERMQSMQSATLANEAYQTLKDPTARARYLLKLNGIDTQENTNTSMPADFLMTQMEWRENIEEAQASKDIVALEQQLQMMKSTAKSLQQGLASALNDPKTFSVAAGIVRQLSFIDKVSADVESIISKLEE
jgi:molecular chaperone HscB